MSIKARIDAGGRIVEIETDDAAVSTKDLAARVLAVWEATASATRRGEGPAVGFQAERRGTSGTSPMSMAAGGYVLEPKAQS